MHSALRFKALLPTLERSENVRILDTQSLHHKAACCHDFPTVMESTKLGRKRIHLPSSPFMSGIWSKRSEDVDFSNK